MKVCVIGGGPAGMMCATMIAQRGHEVTLLEKNEKLGKKLYLTGKGRCNITNASSGQEFLKNIVHGQKFVMGAITRFDYNDTINFFKSVGVPLKIERGNRVFPESDKSSDIIKGMEQAMRNVGVLIHLNCKAEKILSSDGQITGVVYNGKTQNFDAVVVATGGVSYPATGSTGDGYEFAKSVGHSIISPVSALCPIKVNNLFIANLDGLTLKNVKLFAKNEKKTIFQSEIGEMNFANDEISGPIVLTCSSFINRQDFSKLRLFIDFKPALSLEVLENRIFKDIVSLKAGTVFELMEGLLPKQMVKVFLGVTGISGLDKANQLSRENRKRIAFLLKNFELTPLELGKIDNAIVTSGGIELKEINPKYMKSKLISNLYFIGEVLDIDALTGGYNLQLALSTAVTCANDFKDYR